jgi:hypothetical protein
MAASDAAVGRLKTELKRVLRKHVGEVVNDVCDSFVEELRPVEPTPRPHVAQGNEVDYECCRGLEHMERNMETSWRNMETSPTFAQQMDCVILAYQSNASLDILDAVVTQNLWARRKGARVDSLEKKKTDLQVTSDEADRNFIAKSSAVRGSCKRGKVPGKVNGGVAAHKAIASEEKCTIRSEAAKQRGVTGAGDADPVKTVDAEVKNEMHQAAAVRAEKLPHNRDQTERRRVNGSQRSDFQLADSMHAQTKAAFTRTTSIVSSASPVVPAKSSKTRLTHQHHTELLRTSSSEKGIVDSSSAQASATESTCSRPREWGKRKRLVTRKRGKAASAPAKRARTIPPQSNQLYGQSSTETDHSDDEKGGADVTIYDVPTRKNDQSAATAAEKETQQRISKKSPPKRNESAYRKRPTDAQVVAVGLQADNVTQEKSAVPDIEGETSEAMMITAAGHVMTLTPKRGKQNEREEQAATFNGTAEQMKAAVDDTALTTPNEGATADKAEEKKREETENAAEHAGSSVAGALVARSTTESTFESALRQVERDLAAGDMVSGLEIAKAMFREMLDSLKSRENSSTVLVEAKPVEDLIGVLCDPKGRPPDQNIVFKTRLRNTIVVVDAMLCKPPQGYFCSRDCNSIRAQMCNQLTPCINPTCRAWHDAEAHLDRCTNDQCEFKTRIELRETMHLIEHKQQEIANACNALLDANTTLLSLTQSSSTARASVGNAEAFNLIETLEKDLETLKCEQANLIDAELQRWAALNSIGIDFSSDSSDGFPDFDSHYTPRSHRRGK